MDRQPSFKYAVLDLDETLIEGTTGHRIFRALANPRKNKGIIPRRYYIKALRYAHLPLLSRMRRLYRVYRYLLHKTYSLYQSLLSDPRVDREQLRNFLLSIVDNIEIPRISLLFIQRLKERGYTLVLLTATPQELAERIAQRLGIDVVYGSRPGMIMDRENKMKVLKDLTKKGTIEIVVGNPGNEPFHLARRYAIIVRSPKDLNKWLDKI